MDKYTTNERILMCQRGKTGPYTAEVSVLGVTNYMESYTAMLKYFRTLVYDCKKAPYYGVHY